MKKLGQWIDIQDQVDRKQLTLKENAKMVEEFILGTNGQRSKLDEVFENWIISSNQRGLYKDCMDQFL